MRRTLTQSLWLYCAVILTCAFLIFPVYWLVVTALSTSLELKQLPPHFWPDVVQWETLQKVLATRPIPLWLWNSTITALGAVLLSMVVSVLAGYSLSRFSVRGSHSLGLFILTAKMLPATLLVIPLFGIFRQVGLIGSLWSLIIAHATLIIPFSTWMLKGYFDTIPRELEQAAMVDGCSPMSAMVRVVLPVATPGLAATALYAFVLSWSDYAYARTFLTNEQNAWTANLGITTLKGEYVTDWNEVAAASLFVAAPIILIYLFLERFLVGGLTAGAEK
ncbi:carbohydrate ABC transporter permease [Rhizobium sp. NTR19]|uniref:Carbohydrate ABC transporter permease n=1 Tax=Neorhizobium turbinariae TaxID=2937795 RepID=A0ABT0IWN3_9HYPH|nr:carbohydrate ABC transporter permease [Neorhizobium turbinariae]MCK8782297.1 carbohydrate ABC transporter permease [Neorhizobium turbinariae]